MCLSLTRRSNDCKRRKIKCNGETPCQRCTSLGLICIYAPNCRSNNFRDSDEFKRMNAQVGHLQKQVETVLDALCTETLGPVQDRSTPAPSGTVAPRSVR